MAMTKRLHIKIDEFLYDWIKRKATENGKSMGKMTRDILFAEYVEDDNGKTD